LRAWTVDAKLWCLRDGSIYPTSTRNVASGRFFYELPDLTAEDLYFIERAAIDDSPESLKDGHRKHLTMYTDPWNLKRFVESTAEFDPTFRAFVMGKLEEEIVNADESYHGEIEDAFLPYLEEMRAGTTDFYQNDDDINPFLHALTTQYFRTKNMKEAVVAAVKTPEDMTRRIWSPMSHIFAVNTAHSFSLDRARFRIVLVDNTSDVAFIAGDQPIINLHANPFEAVQPKEVEFFYPLSPTKAMFFVKIDNPISTSAISDAQEILRYNILIAQNSHEQIFSDSRELVEEMRQYVREPVLQ